MSSIKICPPPKITNWKNSLGLTSEIAISPEGIDFTKNDFEWRISSAQIQGDNEFSKFPGYDRLLTVIAGDGLLLNGKALRKHEIHRFGGEEAVRCSLLRDPVVDLGIIYKRGVFRCEMDILEFEVPVELVFGGGLYFLRSLSASPETWRIEGPITFKVALGHFPAHFLRLSLKAI